MRHVFSFVLTCSLVVVVSSLAPQQGAGFIREQHHWHLPARSQQEFGVAQSAQAAMSCPKGPTQGDGEPKSKWPELVGKTVDEAKAVLQKEAPGFTIQVIGPDQMATMDWRCNRIRIWLDSQQLVAQPPMIG